MTKIGEMAKREASAGAAFGFTIYHSRFKNRG